MDFTHYYGRHKRENQLVIPITVLQRGKTFQIRAGKELTNRIQSLAKELNQTDSKVIKDILNDFFLDKENIEWQKEVESWK